MINTDIKDIENLFDLPSGIESYTVPDFQRPSSWDSETAERFILDLLECFEFNEEGIFLGNVILLKEKDSDKIEIIDGQQRFLNITILLAVIRDIIYSIDKENDVIDIINQLIIKKRIGKKNKIETTILLVPEIENRDFFYNFIQSPKYDENDISEIQNIRKKSSKFNEYYTKEIHKTSNQSFVNNYIIYYENLKNKFSKDEDNDFIANLLNFLTTVVFKTQIALLLVDNEVKADEIFEAVNSKNVKLTTGDLIKSKVFASSRNTGIEVNLHQTRKDWSEIQNILKDLNWDFKKLIIYYWSSEYGYVSDRRVFTEMKLEFDQDTRNYEKSYKNWNQLLQELHAASKDLQNIISPSVENFIKSYFDGKKPMAIRGYLNMIELVQTLSASKSTQSYILILQILRNLRENKYVSSDSSFVKLRNNLRWFTDFTFLYFDILGKPSNWYHKLICQISARIDAICDDIKVSKLEKINSISDQWKYLAEQFYNWLKKEDITLDQFTTELIDKIEYSKKDNRLLKYFLTKVEHNAKEYLDSKDIDIYGNDTLEHILPQKPMQWGLEISDIKNYVHKVGNMVLLGSSFNGKLDNITFDKKCEFVEKTSNQRPLVKQVFIDKIWDFNKCSKKDFSPIKERSKQLAKIGYELWVTKLTNELRSIANKKENSS